MKKSIIGLVVLVIALIVAMAVFGGARPSPTPTGPDGVPDNGGNIPNTPVSATTTLQGTFTCLPHKNTDGPQTLECAFGLKTDAGVHYALDFSGSPTSAFDLPMDRPYRVTGLLVPIEAISSDQWSKYDIRGIMRVSSYEELTSGIPTVPLGSVTLELNKPVMVSGTTIRVTAVLEDSRCPSDVVCIQAGRALLGLSLVSPNGLSSMTIEIGKTVTTEALAITLDEVRPYPMASQKTADADYRFVLTVKNR